MEQMIIEFFAKASELILHNRLPTTQTWEAIVNKLTNTDPLKFQLSFDQKFDFNSRIPVQWNTHANKLLVIEFFLNLKANNTKFLVEQWIFDMTQVTDVKLKYTIDSSNTLYQKLSVLLRTISLLTVTLPLFQKTIKEKGSKFAEMCTLEHSIHFTRHTLSNWHPSVHEDKDLHSFTSPDFVLPGRTFSFKVNYSKSLKFLQKAYDEILFQGAPELDYVRIEANDVHTPVPEGNLRNELVLLRKAYSENYYKDMKLMEPLYLHDSPPDGHPWEANATGDCISPIDGNLNLLRIATQKSLKDVPPSPRSRRNSEAKIYEINKVMGPSRLRVKTLESESFGEADVFIYENDEGKFTEVLSWKEISLRNKSPSDANMYQTEGRVNGNDLFRRPPEDFEMSKLRFSTNTKPFEKIIQQTEDDKIAELIHSIEELKGLTKDLQDGKCSIMGRKRANTEKSEKQEIGGGNEEKIRQRGLRFECTKGTGKDFEDDFLNPFAELSELKDLYLQIKRSGSM